MTPEEALGVLALIGNLRNQVMELITERDKYASEVLRLTEDSSQ